MLLLFLSFLVYVIGETTPVTEEKQKGILYVYSIIRFLRREKLEEIRKDVNNFPAFLLITKEKTSNLNLII